MAVPGNFFFEFFLRCEYDVVVFEQFKFDNLWQMFRQIKYLLGGRRFGLDRKNKNSRL